MSTVTAPVDEGRVRVWDDEPLRRRRLAVLLRLPLFVPPLVVVALWSALAVPAVVLGWVVLLIAGRMPVRVYGFLAAYIRYVGQASAWFHLLSGRYPSVRHAREHPFTIELPGRAPQPRLVTLFRAPLALPAVILASAFRVVLALAAFAAWFVALALGRTTAGLQELGTFCLRYELETNAYVLLVSSRYPRVSPAPE
ncbi:MAG: DUF4389 domain-containing protein [Gaiellaceae bacterium]